MVVCLQLLNPIYRSCWVMKPSLSLLFNLLICSFSFCVTNKIAIAQITGDGTVNTQVNLDGNTSEITGGETRGGNLFHSFQDFSVPTDNEAFFNNANDITNIFSRVTGGNISTIDGAIRNNGSANLFLINPAGIVFGENARLDLGGSFYGSSASSILFEDGEFNTTDLTNPLLTVNAPIGLGFRDEPGDITNRSTFDGVGLSVNQGQNISLIGGNVNLENGGTIFAPAATINLGGLLEAGTIEFAEDNSFSFPQGVVRGNVSLRDLAIVSILSEGGGSIRIDARNLELATGSNIVAGTNSNTDNENAQAGDIVINTTEDVTVDSAGDEPTQIFNTSFGTGNAGDIEINARNVSLINGGSVDSLNNGAGSTGDISLNASGDILLDGITTQQGGVHNFSTNEESVATVGNISLQGQNLTINNGANIQSLATGETSSGNININIEDTIIIDGFGNITLSDGTASILPSNISSIVVNDSNNIGNSGAINLNAQNLFLSRNGIIETTISGLGSAGNIDINASLITMGEPGNSSILPSYINSRVLGGGTSIEEVDGGNITIDTDSIFVSDGASIGVDIGSDFENVVGTAGNIAINASDTVSVNGTGLINDTQVASSISANIGSSSTGNGGNIQINSPKLLVTDLAFIAADIFNEANGNGGTIEIQTTELSVNNDSYISADILFGANGNAGNLEIDTNELSLNNGSYISTNIFTEANGNGGAIEIQATELSVNNNSFISADVFGTGNGGTIDIQATQLSITNNGSYISADILLEANGNGGNLTIETETLVVRDDAQISANTLSDGNAGNLNITATESIALSGVNEENTFRSGLFAKALIGNGRGGNISITTGELNISDGAAIEVGNFPSFAASTTQPGTGEPGTININANAIALSDEGRVVATTQSPAGDETTTNIVLQVAEDLTLRNNALISAEAFNLGNGGNLSIDSRFIIAFPSSGDGNDIIANAEQGRGGDITINSTLLGISEGLATPNNNSNDIDASSQFDLNGNITIDNPDNNIIQGAIELPKNIIESEQTPAQVCQANRETVGKSSFVVKGKGGIPAAPDLPLDSFNLLDNEAANSAYATPQPIETSRGKVQPARGIEITESGDTILTAHRTNNSGERLPEAKVNCGV